MSRSEDLAAALLLGDQASCRRSASRELTHLDYARAMAFIAIDEATRKMLGVVRLHLDDGPQGRRIRRDRALGAQGSRPRLAADAAHDRIRAHRSGSKRVHGQVLAENTTMLRMCAELGFHIEDEAEPRGSRW